MSARSTIAQTLVLALASVGEAGAAATRVKLHVAEAGVYAVTHQELLAAGWSGADQLPSSRLELTSGGRVVPIWVEDGGDGRFGRGDRLVFVGSPAREADGRRNTYARSNVYYLSATGRAHPRPGAAGCLPAGDLSGILRLEKESLRVRFAGAEDGADLWYWVRLSPLDPAPFEIPLDLPALDPQAPEPLRLRAGVRGWSRLPGHLQRSAPDHRVELGWEGRTLVTHDWRETDGAQILEALLPAGEAPAAGTLTLRVPERRLGEPPAPVVDAVLLDWVEVVYPHLPVLGAEQELLAAAEPGGDCVSLGSEAGGHVAVYPVAADLEPGDGAPPGGRWRALTAAGYRAVERIAVDAPADLRRARRADLVMIAHPTLLAASEQLAALHRRRGLAVELVSVEEVYDEFSHGVAHPAALRDFLRHAHCCWSAPAPRHVLLVGDASWDVSGQGNDQSYSDWTFQDWAGAGFGKNASTPYPEPRIDRDLIPAGSYGSPEGPVASDGWFADLDGDDLPDLAIGRLPVASADEVAAVVGKIAAYLAGPDPGSWHRRLLWITNEYASYQQISDELAAAAAGRGFDSRKIYPQFAETSNEAHRQALLEAWDQGNLLVHFLGHGGRYIWRTGAPDLKKNHDLFTLDDLDRLAPSGRLPIVLAMTCYSAPFDHPVADSIGEKLLRLPDRGAIAVVAASWRNSPHLEMSRALVEELLVGGTVGEAVQRAKRRSRDSDLIRQYNLFGDPTLPIAVAAEGVDLRLAGGLRPTVRGEVRNGAGGGGGAARVEWLDRSGAVVASQEVEVAAGIFEAGLPEGIEIASLAGARVAVAGARNHHSAGAVALKGEELESLYRNRVRWATASEVDNYGFDVYRGGAVEGPFVRVNERTIAAAGTTDTPRSYEFVDAPVDPSRVYFYYVESISLSGERQRFTPVERVGPKLPAPP